MLYNPRQDQVARDILAAAQYIREHGWCQHRLYTISGRVCMRGALYAAIGDEEPFSPRELTYEENLRVLAANHRLEEHLELEGRGTELSVLPDWNDKIGRTKEEVLRAMCESVGVTEDVLV